MTADSAALLGRAAVVLVEPWEPGNVGTCARAMRSRAVLDLRLVVANTARRGRLLEGEARRFAAHGGSVLDRAQFFPDLAAALVDCHAAFAFSARHGRERRPLVDLFQASTRMAARLQRQESLALVFGTEESGLSSEHVALATELVRIPAPGAHDVLNLAQSVLIGLGELSRATEQQGDSPSPLPGPAHGAATLGEREQTRADLDCLLGELHYGQERLTLLRRRILKQLMGMFDRSGGKHQDAAVLREFVATVRDARRCGD